MMAEGWGLIPLNKVNTLIMLLSRNALYSDITHSTLEVQFYMNGPSKLHAAISSKQFFGLKLHF